MSAHANLERRRQAIYGWLLLSPAAVLLTVFAFYPSIATLWSSLFSRHTRRNPSEFVGTENYADLFADPTFWLVVKNNPPPHTREIGKKNHHLSGGWWW